MSFPTRIYLTGFMGSGKSTIGEILANVLGYDFVDLDELIQARLGMTISDFFKQEGERAFRNIETECLRQTTTLAHYVIALGGGALVSRTNLRIVLNAGTVVYLQVPVHVLVRRLRRSRKRPMLRDNQGNLLPEDALRIRVESLLVDREPFYQQAHLVVPMGNSSVGMAVDRVVAAIRRWVREQETL